MDTTRKEFVLDKAIELTSGKLSTNNVSDLSVVQVKGGITNFLYLVENVHTSQRVVVRVFGQTTEDAIDRKREMYICKRLEDFNLSKKIYAYFKGGQIEEWIEGDAFLPKHYRDPKINKKIAEKIRELHNIPIQSDFYASDEAESDQSLVDQSKSVIFFRIKKFVKILAEYSEKVKGDFPALDLNQIKTDTGVLEKLCNDTNSPTVLGHGDLLPANILIKNNEICFIDFEYSCPMSRGYDLANHFLERSGDYYDNTLLLTDEEELHFLRSYLAGASEEEVLSLHKEVKPFFMASRLYWGLWALIKHYRSNIDFNFKDYGWTKLKLFLDEGERKKYGWTI